MQLVPINGTSLAYRFDGPEGAPVLMLSNSLGTNSGMWDAQIERLSSHFRVLRYDARGHGESGVPQGPYDIDLLYRDVLGLLDALHLPHVSFCGLSAGGVVGMLLGIKSPARLAKLVLSDGRLVADRIAGAGFVQLEAAHLSNIEQADAFTDGVLEFLLAK